MNCGYNEKFSASLKLLGSSLEYSPNFWQSLISILSTQRSTSLPSSPSALKTASLDIKTAAASWSNPADIWWRDVDASAQFLAIVVTRIRRCPLLCWYWVMNWMQPLPPWGMGAACWLTTSKNNAVVVDGFKEQNFHWHVPPRPTCCSPTLAPFTPSETHGPMAPETFKNGGYWWNFFRRLVNLSGNCRKYFRFFWHGITNLWFFYKSLFWNGVPALLAIQKCSTCVWFKNVKHL